MQPNIKPLSPEQLRYACDPATLSFETTNDVEPNRELIGQPRVARALEFGMGVKLKGYNIVFVGFSGTGRNSIIRNFVEDRSRDEAVPGDWVYVYNFDAPNRPRPIALPAGEGQAFHDAIKNLVESITHDLPQAFESMGYRDGVRALIKDFDKQRDELLQPLRAKAQEEGFELNESKSGFDINPISDDSEEAAPGSHLSAEERQTIRETRRALQTELYEIRRQIFRIERDSYEKQKELDREAVDSALLDDIESLQEQYQDQPDVLAYINSLFEDLADQIIGSVNDIEEQGLEKTVEFRRYEVNVLVDNSETEGAPVLVESNPTYENLFGRLEPELESGTVSTHFMRMKAGALHLANGGYLIIGASASAQKRDIWDALIRALDSEEIELRTPRSDGSYAPSSVWPEPVPLNIKVIVLRSPSSFESKLIYNEDFLNLFKVRSEFSDTMPRDTEHEQGYAAFISSRCKKDNLRPFDRSAVAKIIEYSSRLVDHQHKLNARFGVIADLTHESDYWAGQNTHEIVTADDVQKALDQRFDRAGESAERGREYIAEGMAFLVLEGDVVGQINGLTIRGYGEFSYGLPSRITARTYMGDAGVIHIEREIEMAGPLHDKGLLTLSGYLGGTYAQDQPLTLNASLTFEQNYGPIDGDSASSAELYALLSSLSGLPINQAIGVTGSVNQRGEVQPIGGINEKIEGFFDACRTFGLTGEQGVMMPASNISELMLNEDVVEAVAGGQFHIWPISTIDEGIELLTGQPAGEPDEAGHYLEGTVHHAVKKRLRTLAIELEDFGNDKEEDKDEKES